MSIGQALGRAAALLAAAALLVALPRVAGAQTFGVELHNTVMPAAGAMGGASIAKPQDVTSAINGNPAALSDFRGTQFAFSGAWAEPTYNLSQTSNLPIVGPPQVEPFSAKSTAQGAPVGNIGVTQDLDLLGMPATFGLGFVTTSGCFADFRHVPESNGTNTGLTVFSLPMALGAAVTDNLSLGASLGMGIAFYDGPFVGASGMTNDYALRGTVGANYRLSDATTAGAYYQTEESFQFDNAFLVDPGPGQSNFDINMDLPQNVGLGVANDRLFGGRLLVAADLLYKLYDEADLYGAIYDNQWVAQFGSQYTVGRYRLRAGYAWAENPIDQTPDLTVGGVPLGDLPAVRYTQGLLAVTGEHRISGGVGVADVLPGLDLDAMAGGMFHDAEQLGPFTETSIASYWIGFGLTWRFDHCQAQTR